MRTRDRRALLMAGSAGVACAATSLAQSIVYVNRAAAPGGDGHSWGTAFRDLQDALTVSSPIQVWVAQGVYTPDRASGDRLARFNIGARSLYGGFVGNETSIDQRDPAAHVTVLSGDLAGDDGPGFTNYGENSRVIASIATAGVLDGFTLRGAAGGGGIGSALLMSGGTAQGCAFIANQGLQDAEGGAVSVPSDSGPAVIQNCRFTGNRKLNGSGGAILAQPPFSLSISGTTFDDNTCSGPGGGAVSGGPAITNCTFDSNTVTSGGGSGGAVYGPVRLLTGCTFLNNAADRGGAVYASGGSGDLLIGCAFSGNHANDGGAVFLGEGTSVVRGSTFSQNVAVRGGAVASVNSSPALVFCTFDHNHGFYGGGAHCDGGRPIALNCRFFGNDTAIPNASGGSGGALYLTNATSPTLAGCLCSGNRADAFGGAVAGESLSTGASIVNCTFSLNHAATGGGAFIVGSVGLGVANCIFWGNDDSAGGISAQLGGGAPASVRYSTIQGWNGSPPGPGNSGADPLLINPYGPDGVAGTDDDDLRLPRFSPACDSGDTAAVPRDDFDLNGNHNFNEPLPLDANGESRVVDDVRAPNTGAGPGYPVDRGGLEFQPPPCYANCDGSSDAPALNVNDFLCFLARFAAADPYANCDGSTAAPTLNVNDFACFVDAFAGGCP